MKGFLQKMMYLLSSLSQLWMHELPAAVHSQTVKSMTDYNNKATIQRKVAANLLKYIVEAAQQLPSISSDHCVRVLENACSHGVNSVDFALAICQAVADREKSATVSFTFNDLPDNDFDKVLELISSSAVADFNPRLHTIGKSMFSPLMEPGTLDLVYSNASLHWVSTVSWIEEEGLLQSNIANQARNDLSVYVSSRHKELRHGGKLVLSFPGIPDGESGMNSCWPDAFIRIHQIMDERGAASLAWLKKYCNSPVYSRNRAEIASAFGEEQWAVNVMDLQDIEEFGATDYRQGRITLEDIAHRTADMVSSVFRNTLPSIWVEYGGLNKDQAEDLMVIFSESMHQALKEIKSLRVYHLWVIVATKK
ncbi:unnamed protein product [Umbelopsis ramanniana]